MENPVQQNIDLWEIWIEFDPNEEEYFGILYIHGEVQADQKWNTVPVKKLSGLSNHLVLQLPSRTTNNNYTKEVLYSEPIRNLNQYTSVSVYAGIELIISSDEIEVLV